MANDGGSGSGTDEIQMNTECGNEAVNGVEQNERIEIQINIEGENEAMNGIEAGLEGQTGNEARNKPVNGLEGGLEGLTGIKPVNGGLNGSDGGHEAMNEIYGGLDGVNGVQEDECINLDDPLLGKWDAIQIPWEVFDNTQEPPCDNTQTEEETSCGNAKKQGLQVNDHGVKISYGPPPKKNMLGKKVSMRLTVKEAIYVAAKLWLIWSVRNDVIWKGKALCVANLLNHAARLCDLWLSVYSRGDNTAGGNSSEAVWIPPPPSRIKCNVDAALYGDDAGFGLTNTMLSEVRIIGSRETEKTSPTD
nr:uncharacterized protein LOC109163497 [Ipomoea batatas]